MRQAAATALLALYNADDNVSPLHAFTARFSTRFAELVYDVDEGVAVRGVRQRHAHALRRVLSPDMCRYTAIRQTVNHNSICLLSLSVGAPTQATSQHDTSPASRLPACTRTSASTSTTYSTLCVCRSS